MAQVAHTPQPGGCLPHLPRKEKLPSLESLKVDLTIPNVNVTEEDVENYLRSNASSGDQEAQFHLGQFLFEAKRYEEARQIFWKLSSEDVRAKYQMAVMYFDGIGGSSDLRKAVTYMKDISESTDPNAENLIPSALYCVGRSYFGGFGIRRSEETAEKYWIKAARSGDSSGSILSQTILGLLYSDSTEPFYDIKKAHFWHQEATGNGSIESQGALGVMYEHGLAVKRNAKSAMFCYKSAAERGNVYATARLALMYYRGKFFRSAIETCERIVMIENAQEIADKTFCTINFINKGLALACFLYARCLQMGIGIAINKEASGKFYSKSVRHDYDIAYWMQDLIAIGLL